MDASQPTTAEVVQVASQLGIVLDPSEADLYRVRVSERIKLFEEAFKRFPSVERAARERTGRAPSAEADPYNAWVWMCQIAGRAGGSLEGRTVSFKDAIAVAGVPMTVGAESMIDVVPSVDSTVATRLLDAGATIIGKNNTSGATNSWGFGVPGDFQRPLNPHRTTHLTGGSSSGSAAAVAARQVDIAFGSDQSGSIRIPASFCGVLGLKPTYGLVSCYGAGLGVEPTLDHVGPMTLDAETMALALEAVAGYDPLDPRHGRATPDRLEIRGELGDRVDRLRIGVLEEGFTGLNSEVDEAVLAAVDVLADAGAKVTRVSVPEHRDCWPVIAGLLTEGFRAVFDTGFFGAFSLTHYPEEIVAATYALYHERTEHLLPGRKLDFIAAEFSRRRFRGALYAHTQNVRPQIVRAFDRVFRDVDVLAMPTTATTAPQYEKPASMLDRAVPRMREVAGNTEVYNYTGHPAISIPCGKRDGLPIGMQLVTRHFEDASLLSAAYAYQHRVDWESITAVSAAPGP